jgi:predicted RNase H-like nuclease
MRVVGVDGCPGGWVAVTWDTVKRTLVARAHPTFVDVLDVYQDAAVLSVDIPIGVGEGEPRQCDIAARKAISPRGSCVFPALDARLVEALIQANVSAHDFRHALRVARELTDKGISKQAFTFARRSPRSIWP